MADFFSHGVGLVVLQLLFLFYWVPFALAAYLLEVWDPEATRAALRRLVHPIRHAPPGRPASLNRLGESSTRG